MSASGFVHLYFGIAEVVVDTFVDSVAVAVSVDIVCFVLQPFSVQFVLRVVADAPRRGAVRCAR